MPASPAWSMAPPIPRPAPPAASSTCWPTRATTTASKSPAACWARRPATACATISAPSGACRPPEPRYHVVPTGNEGARVGNEARLVWIDLEMTGLDTDNDTILEIATVVTDAELNVLAEGPELAIAQPLALLEAMDEWNRNQHGRSGLWRRVLEEGVPMAEAE